MEGTIGEIRLFAGSFAPRNWAICNGQALSITQNQALFSILGLTYGGDGVSTFKLPDFKGRLPIHPGANHPLGKQAGTNANILQLNQLPGHTHTVDATKQKIKCRSVSTGTSQSPNPKANYPSNSVSDFSYADLDASTPVYLASDAVEVTVGAAGAGAPLENMMPSLCIHFIICQYGIYPTHP